MDNPAAESSNTPLNVDGGAAAFAALLGGEEPPKEEAKADTPETPEPTEAESEQEEAAEQEEGEAEESDSQQRITVTIDGKEVELTPEQIAEAYKGQMRQADYTRKTMELAEQRKATEAEQAKVQAERAEYAQKLNEQAIILQNALAEQQNIDWQQLLQNDPVEYLKQQHLYQERQAALQKAYGEAQQLQQLQQLEAEKSQRAFLEQQQELLLAKLPEWKDANKAKAERTEIRSFLEKSGFSDEEISRIADHRGVMVARKAMLYDKMVEKANAAAKKVSTLPQRVEKPGVSEVKSTDKRSAAFKQLSKSGRVEDAAAVFASIL